MVQNPGHKCYNIPWWGRYKWLGFQTKKKLCVCVYTDYIHDSFLSIINQNNTIIESDSSFTNWFVLFRIKWIQDKRSPISILKKYCFRRLKKKNSKKKNSCQVWSQETACHSENKKGHVLMTSCPCAITSLFSSLH